MVRLRLAVAVLGFAVGCMVAVSYQTAMRLHKSEQMDAVGGIETYRSQRVAALLAMKEKLNVRDPEVRRLQMDEIDQQIADIENEPVWELGQELKIKRKAK